MKFLIFDAYYRQFLQAFHKSPGVRELAFNQYRSRLMKLRFGTSDAYSNALSGLGHEAEEIVTNDAVMQLKWAQENGVRTLHLPHLMSQAMNRFLGIDWRFRIIKEQVKKIR